MKKMIQIVLILGVLALLYQFFVNFFINKRNYNYSLVTDDNTYLINEDYKRDKDVNIYNFLITDKDKKEFVYSYKGDLNKQSRVIKDIVSFKENDLYCIAPVFKNKEIPSMMCRYKDQLVSYSYLNQIGNSNIDHFITKLSGLDYKVNLDYKDLNSAKNDYQNISIYQDIDPNLYFTIWNYNGVYVINSGKAELKDLLEKDSYENSYAILAGKFYVVVDTDHGFNSFYIVNIKDGGKAHIETDESLSGNLYFNGVYKNKVYLTDITNQKQYMINPSSETIELLDIPKYYDGKNLKNIDISSLTLEKKYFVNDIIPDKLKNQYGNEIQSSEWNYYFEDNGRVYQIVGKYDQYKVLLFQFDSFKELKVLNGNIYGIHNDTVYMYNSQVGLKKIIGDRELLYNYKNIFDVYEK